MRAPLLLALALLPACNLAQYTIGGAASAGGCPDGQVVCGDGCAPAGECDDCPEGQVRCGAACVAAGACDPATGCPVGQVECGDGCAPADACPCTEGCDPELEVCDAAACVCRPGLVRCGGACVDTRSDPAHCDGCDQPCDGGALCDDGACVAACGGGHEACGQACVDTSSHALHCGECDKPCAADTLCIFGQCRPYVALADCDACPCADACEAGDSDGEEQSHCCESPFLGVPVCVDVECP